MGARRASEILNESVKANEVFSSRKPYETLKTMNGRKEAKRKNPKISQVDYIADKLVDIYKAPGSRNFFCKCAWHLSEDIIWSAVEDSRKKGVDSPIALFIFICNNALQERPIDS